MRIKLPKEIASMGWDRSNRLGVFCMGLLLPSRLPGGPGDKGCYLAGTELVILGMPEVFEGFLGAVDQDDPDPRTLDLTIVEFPTGLRWEWKGGDLWYHQKGHSGEGMRIQVDGKLTYLSATCRDGDRVWVARFEGEGPMYRRIELEMGDEDADRLKDYFGKTVEITYINGELKTIKELP